jgi:ribonuclease P protein component
VERIRQRRDFLAAAKAFSCAMPGMIVQMRVRADALPPRVGFTVTKKLGNAVARNRSKRRLREAARLTLAGIARPGHDYVLIGRGATAKRPFEDLRKDITAALKRLHKDPHLTG